jgi:hypothetical protein
MADFLTGRERSERITKKLVKGLFTGLAYLHG